MSAGPLRRTIEQAALEEGCPVKDLTDMTGLPHPGCGGRFHAAGQAAS